MPRAATKERIWAKVLKDSADSARARQVYEVLRGTNAREFLLQASPAQARILAALFSGSEALSAYVVANPDRLVALELERLNFTRRKQGIQAEVTESLGALMQSQDYAAALRSVREFKQREMLRIAARDLARLAGTTEIVQELSSVADVCLEAVWNICRVQLVGRYGAPWHQDAFQVWQPTPACVLGMGKLGGRELNYSSDVDVLVVYGEEGSVFKEPPSSEKKGRAILTNHQFLTRLVEAFIAEVTRLGPEGALFRIDFRLRPEGDTGPLCRSLASYENYYAQWGQTWERMMLIKARGVAGDHSLAAEFLEMIQPFRYARSINVSALREVGVMKERIEKEVVKRGELDRNVKLGRGGIREIEFVVQALQLIHGGRQPFLQGAQTLPALGKLAEYELLSRRDAQALAEGYVFLRDIEHRLQMENNLQTHTIPALRSAQERLARLMGFRSLPEFQRAYETHRSNVRRIFESLLQVESPETGLDSTFPLRFEGAEREWKRILAEHAFRDPEKAFRVLREFVEGPGFIHVSPRTVQLAHQLLPRLFALCPGGQREASDVRARDSTSAQALQTSAPASSSEARPPLSDPDRVVTRLDSFISAYGARSTLFELWNSNPGVFELLLLLFDRSEFLAELAIRTPDLVDELVMSGRLRQRKTSEETLRDLKHGLEDEDQHLWLRRYHQTERMRIGLRDILGLADPEQYLTELSALADACLRYALDVLMRRAGLKQPPFAVIGLGKLGGAEIDYGSDLDILFVSGAGPKDLARTSRLAVEFMDLLSRRTEHGVVFQTDARLRPDGEKGLLVNSLKAYEEYYRQRAQLWEIQSLTRTRVVAGDANTGTAFQELAAALTNFAQPNLSLASYVPDWKQRIHQMRLRIEKERTPVGKADLAIKTGAGGLMDAEFVAQAMCLQYGWREANTLRALERGGEAGALSQADKLIRNYRQLRRVEGILRRWSYEGETVLPDDPAPYYRVSVRCGFPTPDLFRSAIAQWRQHIREVYLCHFVS